MREASLIVSMVVWFSSLFVACSDPAPQPKPSSDGATLELGPPITVEVGKKIVLTAETTAKKVTWNTPFGCDSLPLDGKRLAVWAVPCPLDKNGIPIPYVFTAAVPSGDDVVWKQINLTVTGPRPPPPPLDPLVQSAQAAYTADPSPTKATDKGKMQTTFAGLSTQMNDPRIVTVKNLYDFNSSVMQSQIAKRLAGVGKVFEQDFATIFPVGTLENHALTQAERDACAVHLKTYASVLESVK